MRKVLKNEKGSGGVGIGGLLGVVFIVLKLTDVIDWHWIWVLSPFWIHLLIVLFVVYIVYLIES